MAARSVPQPSQAQGLLHRAPFHRGRGHAGERRPHHPRVAGTLAGETADGRQHAAGGRGQSPSPRGSGETHGRGIAPQTRREQGTAPDARRHRSVRLSRLLLRREDRRRVRTGVVRRQLKRGASSRGDQASRSRARPLARLRRGLHASNTSNRCSTIASASWTFRSWRRRRRRTSRSPAIWKPGSIGKAPPRKARRQQVRTMMRLPSLASNSRALGAPTWQECILRRGVREVDAVISGVANYWGSVIELDREFPPWL